MNDTMGQVNVEEQPSKNNHAKQLEIAIKEFVMKEYQLNLVGTVAVTDFRMRKDYSSNGIVLDMEFICRQER